MRTLLRLIRSQLLALLALVVALGSVAYAASVQLGVNNTAPRATGLRNSGDGPALRLTVKPGEPPIAVNSSGLVRKLNASQLQGKGLKWFSRAGSSYTKSQSDARYTPAGQAYSKAEANIAFARVIVDDAVAGTNTPFEGEEAIYSRSITLPGPGTIMAFLAGDGSGSYDLSFNANGIFQDGAFSSGWKASFSATTTSSTGGTAGFNVYFETSEPYPVDFSGRLVVLFVPS